MLNQSGCFHLGEQFTRDVVFDQNAVTQFATMAGHHDEQVAAASPFKSLIASSAHTGALLLGSLATFISSRVSAVGLGFSMRLKKATRVGEKAGIVWTGVSIEPKRKLGGDVITFEGKVFNSQNQVAVTATCDNLIFNPARQRR